MTPLHHLPCTVSQSTTSPLPPSPPRPRRPGPAFWREPARAAAPGGLHHRHRRGGLPHTLGGAWLLCHHHRLTHQSFACSTLIVSVQGGARREMEGAPGHKSVGGWAVMVGGVITCSAADERMPCQSEEHRHTVCHPRTHTVGHTSLLHVLLTGQRRMRSEACPRTLAHTHFLVHTARPHAPLSTHAPTGAPHPVGG